MRKLLLLIFAILLLGNVLAVCGENQINVNMASLAELDELYGIGPAKAQAIVDARPYKTIDDLINANGIGEITLANIKSQGLACIDSENSNTIEETPLDKPSSIEPIITDSSENGPQIVQPTLISLGQDTKAIKSENVNENSGNKAFYGLIVFSVVIIALFLMKKRKYKNEFQ